MKTALGLVMVLMLLSWSVATVHPVMAAVSTNETETTAYDDFWRILNDEAYLVVAFNDSLSSGNPNATLAQKLIENSRQGELNSANISAQIWLALEELKKSGVKLCYSADELKKMAEEIKKNGLPAETVNELKAQGWTDDEIKALEEYIAKNADEITSGFDMGSFLTNFSQAFVMVGFKYADYETWAFEKWKWSNPAKSKADAMKTYGNAPKKIVPDLADQWSKFYHAYLSDDVNGMSSALGSMEKTMDSLLINSLWTTVDDGGIIVQNLAEDRIVNNHITLYGTNYYWPTAVEAYKQLRRVYVLVNAIKLGNGNPEIRAMLNREVAELKDALVAYVRQSTSATPSPSPSPIPGPCFPNKCDVALTTSGEPIPSSSLTSTKTSTSQPTDVALDVNSNYGYISIKNVSVVVDNVTSTKATYHIEVSFKAEHNAVSDVKINLTDSSGSDSVKYSMVHPDDGIKVWKSKKFTVNFNGKTQVTVSGTVKISYLSTPTPLPMSNPSQPTVSSSSSSSDVQVAVESYSKTITANLKIDPSKVFFAIVPSKTEITEGSSVSFTIKIRNENDVPISGQWSFHASYKDSSYKTHSFDRSGSVTVQAHDTVSISVGPVVYPVHGTYGYSGSFKFGPNLMYSRDNSSEIVVVVSSGTPSPSPTPSTGRLRIVSVTPEPAYPKEGDTVSFDVKIDSSYQDTKRAIVKLYVDGGLKDSKKVDVSTSGASVTLQWLAHAGEHSYTVKVYRLVDGQELFEDSRSRKIDVRRAYQQFAVKLEAFPTELEGGGTVFFTVKVWNFANDALNVQFHVVNESGKVVYPQKGGWVSKYIPKGAENYTLTSFDRDVFGIGDHTYTVVARISGEEENDSVTIKVTPSNGTLKQVGFECSDLYFKYDMGNYKAALTCRLSIFNGYPYPVFINNSVVSTISISPKTLAKYLRSRILIDTVSNRTILSKRYLTIASTAYFFVPKQDLPLLLSKIFPQLADAGADVKVENIVIHTTTATVNMTYNLTLDIQGELKIKRYRVTSIIHVKVDQVAVVADILADVGLTYGAFKGVNAVTDVSLFKKFITKVPPKYRYALGFLGQISLNDIKEQIITTVSG